MGNVIIIPENLMALSQAGIVAASEASASMPAANMLIERPSKFWRSTSSAAAHTPFYAYVKNFSAPVNAVAFVKHNLRRGDQYRVWLNTSPSIATRPNGYVAYDPTSKIAGISSNTTSTYTDVDNNETTPGATFAVPTTLGTAWALGLGFNTPAIAPLSGTDLQAFAVFAKTQNDLPTVSPTVTAYLYEDVAGTPTLRATLGTKVLRSTAGQWMFFPWNASLLAAPDGSGVEIRLVMSASDTQYVSVGSVVWLEDCDTRAADSGWLTYDPFVGSGITYKPEVEGRGNVLLYQLGATYSPRHIHVQFRQSCAPSDIDTTLEVPPSPPGYLQIGTLVAGEIWQPAINIKHGKLAGVVDPSPRRRTYGGGLFGSRRPTRRVVAVDVGHQTKAEAHTILDRVLWRHGLMKPFVVSTTPDDATQSKATTIFGHLRNAENWLNIQPDEGYENNFSLEFEEVL